jgi:hypothetical protein
VEYTYIDGVLHEPKPLSAGVLEPAPK